MEPSGEAAEAPSPSGEIPELVKMLMAMGIEKELATQAVWVTGTTTADAALTWIFENRDSVEPSEERLPPDGALVEGENVVKMVFVVNMDLKMGVGKVAAQVAHAAVGLHKFLLQNQEIYGHLLLLWDADGETKIVLKGDNITILEDLRRKAEAAGLPCYLVNDAGRTQTGPDSPPPVPQVPFNENAVGVVLGIDTLVNVTMETTSVLNVRCFRLPHLPPQIPAGSSTVLAVFGRVNEVDDITGQLKLL